MMRSSSDLPLEGKIFGRRFTSCCASLSVLASRECWSRLDFDRTYKANELPVGLATVLRGVHQSESGKEWHLSALYALAYLVNGNGWVREEHSPRLRATWLIGTVVADRASYTYAARVVGTFVRVFGQTTDDERLADEIFLAPLRTVAKVGGFEVKDRLAIFRDEGILREGIQFVVRH